MAADLMSAAIASQLTQMCISLKGIASVLLLVFAVLAIVLSAAWWWLKNKEQPGLALTATAVLAGLSWLGAVLSLAALVLAKQLVQLFASVTVAVPVDFAC